MTTSDYQPFVGEFRRLVAALEPYKSSPEQMASRADAYFSVLKPFPLEDVIRKADTWLAKETKFPKPAEWAGVIVRKAADLPTMLDRDARDYREAERIGFEKDPCGCQSCLEAGVSEKPLRYVPEVEDGADRVMKDPLGNRTITAGHWAHGWELHRWYEARGAFWNRVYELGLMTPQQGKKAEKLPFGERLERIFTKVGELTR